MNSAPYGDTGEDDMEAPGVDSNMRPRSTPPSINAPMTPHDALDHGKSAGDPNETLRLLGAGQPYMTNNR